MIPVRSIRRLIQEDYYPDEFKVLVCCLLLNRTRGMMVRSVLPHFFTRWPSAIALALASEEDINESQILRPLGFNNRRARLLIEFARAYERGWVDPRQLPGVGEYAFDCWRIFFAEDLGEISPKDHALVDYWKEAKGGLWPREGWSRDAAVDSRRVALQKRAQRWKIWDPGTEEWLTICDPPDALLSRLVHCHDKRVGETELRVWRRGDDVAGFFGDVTRFFGHFVDPLPKR